VLDEANVVDVVGARVVVLQGQEVCPTAAVMVAAIRPEHKIIRAATHFIDRIESEPPYV